MKVPSRAFALPARLRIEPREVDSTAWQAHVVKHPFGMGALMHANGGRGRAWNLEGWDGLTPPVITGELRRARVAAIQALAVDGASCQLGRLHRESYGGEAPVGWQKCYECQRALAGACAESTADIGGRYRDVVDETLASIADEQGLVVSQLVLARLITPKARRPDLNGLVVLTAGLIAGGTMPGVRVHRWDGVRVELTRHFGQLSWRTTLRRPPADDGARITFLLAGATQPATMRDALSGMCVVPRHWWVATGASV